MLRRIQRVFWPCNWGRQLIPAGTSVTDQPRGEFFLRGHGAKRLVKLSTHSAEGAIELAWIEGIGAAVVASRDNAGGHQQIDPELPVDDLAIEFGQPPPVAELVDS